MQILHWPTRDRDVKATGTVPYRLLEKVSDFGFGAPDASNRPIQSDKLKVLPQFYARRVKCADIDPP